MNAILPSSYWYRVASLKPALRETVSLSRHIYRGQPWYILRDRISGDSHRFNADSYALIGRMDGRRTVQEIWESCDTTGTSSAPTQDEFIRLLGRLHDADLIRSDILPSTLNLVRSGSGTGKNGSRSQKTNPFYLRFPLVDPNRFLDRWSFLVEPLFTRGALILWLLTVAAALVVCVLNWPEITHDMTDRILSAHNLIVLWLVYPIVKIVHELAHAFAVKKWGGEVHEMGIALIALTPIPYVDASDSSAFEEKRKRIGVAAAGMISEIALAALALFVWTNVQKGWVSIVAYNIIMIGGLSTILFNGNPLLRYDGYYILSDLIEIPNLAQRAAAYLGYLGRRYLFGINDSQSPVTAPGERGWFVFYGPVSFCYRIVVLVGLAMWISHKYATLGVMIATWGIYSQLVLPAARSLQKGFSQAFFLTGRRNAVVLSGMGGIAVSLVVALVPIPLWTMSQGVIWLPEKSAVRAGTDLEVVELLASDGQQVDENTPLVRGIDPFIDAQIEILKAGLEELYVRYHATPFYEQVDRKMLLDEIAVLDDDLKRVMEKRSQMVVCSPSPGQLCLLDERNLVGRMIGQGELIGYIVTRQSPTVRAVVSQDNIGLVRERLSGVEVRLIGQPEKTLPATVKRILPSADYKLPSPALGTFGGGEIAVDPSDKRGMQALEAFFQVDVKLPEPLALPHFGERVYVRFEHRQMPLLLQICRYGRQLFIRKFSG